MIHKKTADGRQYVVWQHERGEKRYPCLLSTTYCLLIKKEAGFTLIELLITMVVFVLVIAAVPQIFTGLLNSIQATKQDSRDQYRGYRRTRNLETGYRACRVWIAVDNTCRSNLF